MPTTKEPSTHDAGVRGRGDGGEGHQGTQAQQLQQADVIKQLIIKTLPRMRIASIWVGAKALKYVSKGKASHHSPHGGSWQRRTHARCWRGWGEQSDPWCCKNEIRIATMCAQGALDIKSKPRAFHCVDPRNSG